MIPITPGYQQSERTNTHALGYQYCDPGVAGLQQCHDQYLVAFMLLLGVATIQQTGVVSVPGVSQPATAHAEDWQWIPCVAGRAQQWGALGYVAYEWYAGNDWELGGRPSSSERGSSPGWHPLDTSASTTF